MMLLTDRAYRATLGSVRTFALRIAELPPEQRTDAVSAAERYYSAMLGNFGYGDPDREQWAVMTTAALRVMVQEHTIEPSAVANS